MMTAMQAVQQSQERGPAQLPDWGADLSVALESGACGQFVLYGNIHDRFAIGDRFVGIVEFVESARTLEDYHGQDSLRNWLRQDIALWRLNDVRALPMGYLLCGPIGTGQTFLVECLAGEAGVPVLKLKNFRDKWIGSSEANLEKIFRLIRALGRCIVFWPDVYG
jgi:hypothetical protein